MKSGAESGWDYSSRYYKVCYIGVQKGLGDGPSPPTLLGNFVKDFTKTVDFSQYSPPL